MLRAGGLVAFGTETVYGLGGDATNGRAVAAIFQAKGRPHFNPLICHFPDADAAFAHVHTPGLAGALAAAFWPGPPHDDPAAPCRQCHRSARRRRARYAGGARARRGPGPRPFWRRAACRWPHPRPTGRAPSARPAPPMSWPIWPAGSARCWIPARPRLGWKAPCWT